MSTPGILKFTCDRLTDMLRTEEDQYARYTLGMLRDILERVNHTIDAGTITDPELMSATIKVLASTAGILILEMAKEGHEDACKETTLKQMSHGIDTTLELNKDCKEGRKDFF